MTARQWLGILLGGSLACFLVIGAIYLLFYPREFDKVDAARALVAWVVEGRPVPGSGLPHTKRPEKQRFFVVCDFLPHEVSLSDDPRVHRLAAEDKKAAFQKHAFDSTVYVTITVKSDNDNEFVFYFTHLYGGKGGYSDEYTFQRKGRVLRCSRKALEAS